MSTEKVRALRPPRSRSRVPQRILRAIQSLGMLLLLSGLVGCPKKGLQNDWTYYEGDIRYKIGKLDSTWRKVKFEENDIAFYNGAFAAIIQINATCRRDYEDVSLKILTDQLLYGLTGRRIKLQEKRIFRRRSALYTELTASLDGVPVRAAMMVMKKDECIYDFTYLARPHNYTRGIGSYHRVLQGFRVLN